MFRGGRLLWSLLLLSVLVFFLTLAFNFGGSDGSPTVPALYVSKGDMKVSPSTA